MNQRHLEKSNHKNTVVPLFLSGDDIPTSVVVIMILMTKRIRIVLITVSPRLFRCMDYDMGPTVFRIIIILCTVFTGVWTAITSSS